ncbi:hypothetical protein Q8F55_004795 [Vanrija albida]|uniref:Uncharacterized protein n=1 Tax=Vanrija albida TaxID=181172 RepID=A0ABR3Q031_9TREE
MSAEPTAAALAPFFLSLLAHKVALSVLPHNIFFRSAIAHFLQDFTTVAVSFHTPGVGFCDFVAALVLVRYYRTWSPEVLDDVPRWPPSCPGTFPTPLAILDFPPPLPPKDEPVPQGVAGFMPALLQYLRANIPGVGVIFGRLLAELAGRLLSTGAPATHRLVQGLKTTCEEEMKFIKTGAGSLEEATTRTLTLLTMLQGMHQACTSSTVGLGSSHSPNNSPTKRVRFQEPQTVLHPVLSQSRKASALLADHLSVHARMIVQALARSESPDDTARRAMSIVAAHVEARWVEVIQQALCTSVGVEVIAHLARNGHNSAAFVNSPAMHDYKAAALEWAPESPIWDAATRLAKWCSGYADPRDAANGLELVMVSVNASADPDQASEEIVSEVLEIMGYPDVHGGLGLARLFPDDGPVSPAATTMSSTARLQALGVSPGMVRRFAAFEREYETGTVVPTIIVEDYTEPWWRDQEKTRTRTLVLARNTARFMFQDKTSWRARLTFARRLADIVACISSSPTYVYQIRLVIEGIQGAYLGKMMENGTDTPAFLRSLLAPLGIIQAIEERALLAWSQVTGEYLLKSICFSHLYVGRSEMTVGDYLEGMAEAREVRPCPGTDGADLAPGPHALAILVADLKAATVECLRNWVTMKGSELFNLLMSDHTKAIATMAALQDVISSCAPTPIANALREAIYVSFAVKFMGTVARTQPRMAGGNDLSRQIEVRMGTVARWGVEVAAVNGATPPLWTTMMRFMMWYLYAEAPGLTKHDLSRVRGVCRRFRLDKYPADMEFAAELHQAWWKVPLVGPYRFNTLSSATLKSASWNNDTDVTTLNGPGERYHVAMLAALERKCAL